jgi:hypothetical protein
MKTQHFLTSWETIYYLLNEDFFQSGIKSSFYWPNYLYEDRSLLEQSKNTIQVVKWASNLWSILLSTVFTKCHCLTLCWASSALSTLPTPISQRSVLILSANLSLCVNKNICLYFCDQSIAQISHFLHAFYMFHPHHPPWFNYPNNIRWSAQILKTQWLQDSLCMLRVTQLVKKHLNFIRKIKLNATFTLVCHWTQPWASWIQPIL